MWTFRPLTRRDFPRLGAWLAEAHVARWWDHDSSAEGVERDFGDSVDGTDPGEVFVAERDGIPLGLIQRFMIGWYPEYGAELAAVADVPVGAASIDYFVGEPDAVGRGCGTAMIAAFVDRLWVDYDEATCVVVAVHADNIASWRALEKAGFRHVGSGAMEPDTRWDDRRHVVYRCDRPAASPSSELEEKATRIGHSFLPEPGHRSESAARPAG